MFKHIFQALRSAHYYTEGLEFFDWDEERYDSAMQALSEAANEHLEVKSFETKISTHLVEKGFTEAEAEFLIEMLQKIVKNQSINEEACTDNK